MTEQLSAKYQQKTDKAHILDNPDTYIGSVEHVDSHVWIYDDESNKIIEKNINYIPGLFKLFDEGIVNCRDHVIRMTTSDAPNAIQVSHIDVSIDNTTGTITMTNDGNGIDIAMHPEYGIWIPEMIFGHLRTSTNYDKTEKKIVGGKNGFGFKLVLIWSSEGTIETVDHTRGLKYTQTFRQNLDIIEPPVITKCKGKPYTKITFRPDYPRLGMETLTPDMLALFKKRVYDISAVTDKSLKVRYNGDLLPVKNFQQYIDLYIGARDATKDETIRVYEAEDQRWEYAVALSPSHEFIQVSFVNGIHTGKGGKHVEYILNQITRKMVDFIEKKKKVKVNSNSIKEQLMLFIRCDIENPAFDSQTKDCMNTPIAKFGSSCTVSDKFIEKVAKMGVMDAACAINDIKENKAAKKSDGVKTKNIRGIPKLMDANWAGTERSGLCSIIFCEGDSAKAGIVSGLSSEDRNTIGVYPLKGKVMNVRGELAKRISENKEITEIKKILGLEIGKKYLTVEDVASNLRYGKVLFLTDQDADGSHIKGLCVNLFQTEWGSLIRIPEFIGFMNTPILKARRGANELLFYNDGEYNAWKASGVANGWKIKYYKGLGTSTGKEFKEYFEHKKIVSFTYAGEGSDDAIDMVFNKKRADDRKDWLEKYDRDSYVDTSNPAITYEEFIHKELIHFSKYDCDRSIPNLMDGLKISLRKILYAAFKKNLTSEIKVAQFSGYVSEHSCYHHGEASLNQAIVGMAQNFVGSNNINLLVPSGQFGTRMQGGKDSASERYIFTQLSKISRLLFPVADDAILKYLNDDGYSVEPTFYAPIIPMVLVNGSKGIGTGFSTEIMCYNPLQIIAYLRRKLRGEDVDHIQFVPYYEGFTGSITQVSETKYLFRGRYERVGADKIRVTELPVGHWTQDFKEMLEEMTDSTVDKAGKKIAPAIRDYDDMSKDTTVDMTVSFPKDRLNELEAMVGDNGINGVEKLLKLCSTSSTTNMHLFNHQDKLKKYACVPEIIDDYYETRMELYGIRKMYLIALLERELMVLSNKARYVQEILDDTIDLRRKTKERVVELLVSKQYDIIDEDVDYKYLVKMSMDSVTEENVAKMMEERDKKAAELEVVMSKPTMVMWEEELIALELEYNRYRDERERSFADPKDKKDKVSKKPPKK